MIPTYSFDGARLRDYSLEGILWLEEHDSFKSPRVATQQQVPYEA
jgi:hypothetical protein